MPTNCKQCSRALTIRELIQDRCSVCDPARQEKAIKTRAWVRVRNAQIKKDFETLVSAELEKGKTASEHLNSEKVA
jgi:hypothetical protein